MGFLDALLRAEREIEKRIDRAFGQGASRAPLELRREILDDVESRIVTGAQGKVFPFGRLVVHLQPADGAAREIFQAAFVEGGSLAEDIRGLLARAGCASAGAVEISVDLTDPPAEPAPRSGFTVELAPIVPARPRRKKVPPPAASLDLIAGTAEPSSLHGAGSRIHLGRMREVFDRNGQLVRRNDLAFLDNGDEINSTVGRAHATIFLDEETGDYRIMDETSRFGTRIFRESRSIEVPAGKPRGVKLRSGDEIYLGRACLRFRLG